MTNSPVEVVAPTRNGKDLENEAGTADGHTRIETYYGVGTHILVDFFDSAVGDPQEAYMTSEMFDWNDEGADGATRFLQKRGFRVAVMVKRLPALY